MSNAKFEIEIFGDTAKFENSLKGVNTAMSGLKQEASGLRQALSLDPSNMSKMQALQKNYSQQLEISRNKASQLKDEISKLDRTSPDGEKQFIKLSADLQKAQTQAGYLEKDLSGVGQALKKGDYSITVDAKTETAGSKFNALKEIAVGSLRQIGYSITNYVGNKFSDWVGGAADAQKANIALKNTMNYSGVGKDFDGLSKRMTSLATATNANTSDTTKLASTFVGLGDSASIAGDKVESIVKANQAFGGDTEALNSVSTAYGQMSASGKVTAENINQLTDANTALGSALKTEIMKNPALKSFSSFSEASEKGAVSVGMLDEAMSNLGQAGGGASGPQTIDDALASMDETISAGLLPILQELTPIINDVITSITDALPGIIEQIGNVISWIAKNKEVLGILLGVIGSVVAIIGIANMAWSSWIAIQIAWAVATVAATAVGTAFGAVIAFITSPISLVILAITALIAIGVLLYQNWETVSAFAQSIWGGIVNFFKGVGTSIGNAFKSMGEWIGNVFSSIGQFAQNAWNKITSVFSAVGSWFGGVFNAAGNVVSNVFSSIGNFASNAWSFIVSIFNGAVSFYSEVFNGVLNVVSSVFSGIGNFANSAWNVIRGAFSSVGGFFSNIFNGASNAVSGAFSAFGNFASNAWSTITGVFSGVVGWFSSAFSGIADAISAPFQWAADKISGIVDGIKNIAGSVGDALGFNNVVEMSPVVNGTSLGAIANSSYSTNTSTSNTFYFDARTMDINTLARAVKREIDLGRA